MGMEMLLVPTYKYADQTSKRPLQQILVIFDWIGGSQWLDHVMTFNWLLTLHFSIFMGEEPKKKLAHYFGSGRYQCWVGTKLWSRTNPIFSVFSSQELIRHQSGWYPRLYSNFKVCNFKHLVHKKWSLNFLIQILIPK